MISTRKQNRILGTNNNILKVTNKDRDKILLIDWFNTEIKNALSSGLSMYNDEKKDASLIATMQTETKENLKNSDFNAANKIIDNVKKLDSNDVFNIGVDKIKKDTNEITDNIWNYINKISDYFKNILNIPLSIGIIFLIIIIIKK